MHIMMFDPVWHYMFSPQALIDEWLQPLVLLDLPKNHRHKTSDYKQQLRQ